MAVRRVGHGHAPRIRQRDRRAPFVLLPLGTRGPDTRGARLHRRMPVNRSAAATIAPHRRPPRGGAPAAGCRCGHPARCPPLCRAHRLPWVAPARFAARGASSAGLPSSSRSRPPRGRQDVRDLRRRRRTRACSASTFAVVALGGSRNTWAWASAWPCAAVAFAAGRPPVGERSLATRRERVVGLIIAVCPGRGRARRRPAGAGIGVGRSTADHRPARRRLRCSWRSPALASLDDPRARRRSASRRLVRRGVRAWRPARATRRWPARRASASPRAVLGWRLHRAAARDASARRRATPRIARACPGSRR